MLFIALVALMREKNGDRIIFRPSMITTEPIIKYINSYFIVNYYDDHGSLTYN